MGKNQLYTEYMESMYEVLADLSKGETGRTFLARHRGTDKIVIKKHVPEKTGKIYEKLRTISHPNLVKIDEVCYNQEEAVIIEEFVSGATLEEKLEELKVFPEAVVWDYTRQILEGLKQIHELGVIHRDLTPANVLVSTDGVIKLMDFGIARNQKENQSHDTMILGTVGYASPEQFGFLQTDARTDIYALGILLNKMLTGKLPNEQLTEHQVFREIITTCTQIDPEKRYMSVEKIIQKLKEKEKKEKPGEKDPSIWPGFRSNVRWRKNLAAAGYVMLGLVTVVRLTECGTNIGAWLLEAAALFIYVWLTFLAASNFGRWDRRMPLVAKMPKEVAVAFRIVLCFVLMYLGILLEDYVRYTMLGLPLASSR